MAEETPSTPASEPTPEPTAPAPDAAAPAAQPEQPAQPAPAAASSNNPLDSLEAALAAGSDPSMDQASIDELLQQASFEDPAAITGDASPDPAHAAVAAAVAADTQPFNLPNLTQAAQDAQVGSIELLRDVDLNVKIELGRARMLVEDVLKLGEGSVVELDKLAGDPVDIFVNDRLVARGEVLVLNDNFCVRINEIVAGVKEEGL